MLTDDAIKIIKVRNRIARNIFSEAVSNMMSSWFHLLEAPPNSKIKTILNLLRWNKATKVRQPMRIELSELIMVSWVVA